MMHIIYLTISYLTGNVGASVEMWGTQFNMLFAIWALNTTAYCNFLLRGDK
jgi:hypothetical protein